VRGKMKMTILPESFEWLTIPEGQATLKPSKYLHDYLKTEIHLTVSSFRVSKIPITNSQYAQFIEAGGYSYKQWWTDAGWDAKQAGWDEIFITELERESSLHWMPTNRAWEFPRFWYDKKLNRPEQPVVGISWYEALAFCGWFSQMQDEKITLPTDAQLGRMTFPDESWYWSLTLWDNGESDMQQRGLRMLRGGLTCDTRYGSDPVNRSEAIGFFVVCN